MLWEQQQQEEDKVIDLTGIGRGTEAEGIYANIDMRGSYTSVHLTDHPTRIPCEFQPLEAREFQRPELNDLWFVADSRFIPILLQLDELISLILRSSFNQGEDAEFYSFSRNTSSGDDTRGGNVTEKL